MPEKMPTKKTQRRCLQGLALTGLAILAACANNDEKWQEHEKGVDDPPKKYEAPYSQIREKNEQERPSPSTATLPPPKEGHPEVVPPEPWKSAEPILYGIAVKDKNIPKGYVLSPYAPDKGLVDVTGFPAGTAVLDPYSNRMMKVPVITEEERPKEQTLQKPSEQTPVVSKLPRVSAPPSMENP